jgi:hypothetical protein
MRRKLLGDRHWRTSDTRCTLGACLTALGRYEDAESHLLEGYAVLKDRAGLGTPRKRRIVEHIAELYEAWGREDKARLWRTSLDALP